MQYRLALLWHDTVIYEVTRTRDLVVGDRRGPPLADPHLAPGAPLITVVRDELLLTVPRGRTVRVDHGPRATEIDGPAQVALSLGDTATVRLRDTTLVLQPMVPERRVPRPPLGGRLDSGLLGALLIALVAHFTALIFAFVYFEATPNLTAMEFADRTASIVSMMAPPEPPPPPAEETITEDPGKAAKDDEGAFGKPDRTEKTRLSKREGAPVEKAREAGVLPALGDPRLGGALKSVFGSSEGFARDLGAKVAGHDGDFVVGRGLGMGIRDTGRGGGGAGAGIIGANGWLGDGPGRKAKSRMRTREQTKKRPTVTTRRGSFTAFCKPRDIQRVVVARRRGVQHCYERALAKSPELSGKVTMTWRIGTDGRTTAVRVASSKLGSRDVEGCMRRVIERWQFPAPEGGVCQVRYPFVFNSGL